MMVNLAALKAEITKPEYDGMSDDQIAHTINNATATIKRPIPFSRVSKDFIATGTYAAAILYAENAANPEALRKVCITVTAAIDRGIYEDLDPDDPVQGPQIAAILDGLQAAGCLTDDARALILSRQFVDDQPAYLQFNNDRIDWVMVRDARAA